MIPPDANSDATSSKYNIEIGQAQGAVFGDSNVVINHFTVGIRELPTDYAARVKNFLTEYLGLPHHPVPFGGRTEDLAYLDAWLDNQHAPPYLLLAAPAGRGKSALLARWSLELTERHDLAIAYFPVSIRFRTNLAGVVFPALTARLAKLHGEKAPTDLHTPIEMWRGLLTDYLARPPADGRRLLVILDGVDEAAGWEVGADLFPLDPPVGMRVVLAARYLANDRDATAWLNRLGWTSHGLAHARTLHSLDLSGVANVMQQTGLPHDRLSIDMDIAAELHRLSEGDPLLVRLYIDELREQGEMAVHLQTNDLRSIHPGLSGYFDRWWEDQRRQWDREVPLREPAVQTLLNLLACAFGPLTREDLLQLAPQETGFSTWLIESTLEPLKRFVIGDGSQQGYVFSHSQLAIYFYERLSQIERQQTENDFLQWGRRIFGALTAGQLAPKNVPAYLVQYYVVHLERANCQPNEFLALASDIWCQAWESLEGSYAGFLHDLDRAWCVLERVDHEAVQAGGTAPFLDGEIRCALCQASIMSLAGNIPPKLIARLVKEGIWSAAQGLAYARQKTEPSEQSDTLIELAPLLPQQLLSTSLEMVRSIAEPWPQSRALVKLAPLLPIELLGTALEITHSMRENLAKIRALRALAVQLPLEERLPPLQLALAETRTTKQIGERSDALKELIPHLPPELLSAALTIAYTLIHQNYWEILPDIASYFSHQQLRDLTESACSQQNEYIRCRGLTALALCLPTDLLSPVLKATYTIQNAAYRMRVLQELVPRLSSEEQRQTVQSALATACTTRSDLERREALIMLAPYLSGESLQIALKAALDVRDKQYKVLVLAALAAQLPSEDRLPVLQVALEALRGIQHNREDALKALAPYLSFEMLNSALEIVCANRWYAEDLRALAPYLPPELLERALKAAYAQRYANDRVFSLEALIAQLPSEERSPVARAMLEAISEMSDTLDITGGSNKVTAFQGLTSYLTSSELRLAATETALAIQDEEIRVQALTILAIQFPPKERLPLLHTVLELMSAIPNTPPPFLQFGWTRARGLDGLIQYLPYEFLGAAINAARAIQDEEARANVLVEIASQLSTEERPLVMNAIQTLKSPQIRVSASTALAAHLTSRERTPLMFPALEAIRSMKSTVSQARALKELAPHLSAEQLGIALEIALAQSEYDSTTYVRKEGLAALIPYLSSAQIGTVLHAARSIQQELYQAEILRVLIPHLSSEQIDVALEVVRSMENRYRTIVMAMLAMHLPPEERLSILLTVLDNATSEVFWREAIESIIPRLSSELLGSMLDHVYSVKNTHRTHVLSKLAPYLSPAQLGKALEATRSIQDQEERASALASLAPHLSAEQFDTYLEIANSIQQKEEWMRGIVALAPHLPHQLLEAALEIMGTLATDETYFFYGSHRMTFIMASLAPHLPAELMRTALKIACSIKKDINRADVLAALAPYLPHELIAPALNAAIALPAFDSLDGYSTRATALAALAPRLPSESVSKALDATYPIQHAPNQARVLSALVQPLTNLSTTTLYPLWEKTLHMLAARDRTYLFSGLSAMAPLIVKLGGQESMLKIAKAVIDAGNWWP